IEHETIEGRPIDAVFPTQACRNGNRPLSHAWRPRSSDPAIDAEVEMRLGTFDYAQPYLRVIQGHFGLTLVRTQALRECAMPWFMTVPGATGRYNVGEEDGAMDPDTYFWVN